MSCRTAGADHDVRHRAPAAQHSQHSTRGDDNSLGEDPYQHVSISGPVIETWDDPALEVMDRLSMRYTGEPWPEREPCVSAFVEIERWHTYGVLSESSDYSSAEQSS